MLVRGVSCFFVVISTALAIPSIAIGQTICPPEEIIPIQTQPLNGGESEALPVAILPCQTLSLHVVDSGYHQGHVTNVTLLGGNGDVLYTGGGACYKSSCTYEIPANTTHWNPPWRGTAGPGGLVTTGFFNAVYAPQIPVSGTIIITKRPRQGYNQGGNSFGTALALPLPTTVLASVHGRDPGQFFKVTLGPQQPLYFYGTALASASSGVNLIVRVYDSSQTLLATPLNLVAVYGKQLVSGTFTNTNATTADYYVKVSLNTVGQYLHDLQLTLQTSPAQFTLLLDENADFDPTLPAPPQDDQPFYVPGAQSGTGVSLPIPTNSSTAIQRIKIIAAFLDVNGRIVRTTGTANFTLNNTSGVSTSTAFAGIAMNWPDPRGDGLPDFVLGLSSATFQADGTARVDLDVWDYGGAATIRATRGSGSAQVSATIQLPRDVITNYLPDAGWLVDGQFASDSGSASDDTDILPSNNVGDGLTRFEEYRGFVVQGAHIRTPADAADLFIQSYLPQGFGYADALPFNVREVWSIEIATDRAINSYYQNIGAGGTPPGHYVNPLNSVPNQKALQVVDAGYDATFPYAAGETQPIRPGASTPANVLPLRIFTQTIRWISPFTNDIDTAEEDVDWPKTMQTIAHEAGHAVNLADSEAQGQCLPPTWTVMVTNYFAQSTTMTCAWSNIPSVYDVSDLTPLTLRN